MLTDYQKGWHKTLAQPLYLYESRGYDKPNLRLTQNVELTILKQPLVVWTHLPLCHFISLQKTR